MDHDGCMRCHDHFSDSRPERADFRRERVDFRPERAGFRPERAWGGWTDGWMDGQRNESPPVFYRTSSPSGPLPKKRFVVKPANLSNIGMLICPS